MPTEEQIMENLRKCPSFERCSRNLCPLDLELEKRYGGPECRWMPEAREANIQGNKIVFGGRQMPDDLLKFVPEKNVSWLNKVSQNRWFELRKVCFQSKMSH